MLILCPEASSALLIEGQLETASDISNPSRVLGRHQYDLSSIHHPVAGFWQFPTGSMGLSLISANLPGASSATRTPWHLLLPERPPVWSLRWRRQGRTKSPESLAGISLAAPATSSTT